MAQQTARSAATLQHTAAELSRMSRELSGLLSELSVERRRQAGRDAWTESDAPFADAA